MKNLLLIISLATILSLPHVTFAAEQISQFLIDAKINPDSSVNIEERISYDFDTESRHGIFRDIPYKYQRNGANYNIRIIDVSVTDENGAAYKFTTSKSGGDFQIKIGDADATVTGKHVYVIDYKVDRAINYFNDHDEFYWNAVGNQWQVPIYNITAKVELPSNASATEVDCFSGAFGGTQKCGQFDTAGSVLNFQQAQIVPGDAMTLVIGLPKGAVTKPTATENILNFLKDNMVFGVPLLGLLALLILWYKKGRDPKSKLPLVAQYEAPDNLSPAEVGMLLHGRVRNSDISAEIINLAVKGYLRIERIPKKGFLSKEDFKLIKLKPESGLDDFQQGLLKSLFATGDEVLLSVLKKTTKVSDDNFGKKQVSKKLAELGYYDEDPVKIQNRYVLIGGAILFVLAFLVGGFLSWTVWVSIGALAVMIIAIGWIMPRKSQKGADARQLILGLKEYMSVAEKDRLDFHNDPAKDPKVFEKLLPYAIALGVSDQWAKKFDGLFQYQPGWYGDPSNTMFNAIMFNSYINNFNSGFTSMVATNGKATSGSGGSGFGGGGFSGGGMGGGGGGSW